MVDWRTYTTAARRRCAAVTLDSLIADHPAPLAAAALAITLASNVIAVATASAGRRSTIGAGGGARTGSVLGPGPGLVSN